MKSFRSLCAENQTNFTKSEEIIANFIDENIKEVITLTAMELGKKLNMSDMTILRFSKKIGFNKYNDLKDFLTEELDSRKSVMDRMLLCWNNQNEDSTIQIINSDIKNLQKLHVDLKEKDINSVVDIVKKSQKVYVVGIGSSRAVAELLNWHYTVLGINSLSITEGGYGLFEKIANITSKDCVFFFSVPKYLKDEFKALEFLRKKNVPTILITNDIFSKMTNLATIYLPIEIRNTSFFNSFTAAVELCNILLFKIFETDKEKYFNNLKKNEADQEFLYLNK